MEGLLCRTCTASFRNGDIILKEKGQTTQNWQESKQSSASVTMLHLPHQHLGESSRWSVLPPPPPSSPAPETGYHMNWRLQRPQARQNKILWRTGWPSKLEPQLRVQLPCLEGKVLLQMAKGVRLASPIVAADCNDFGYSWLPGPSLWF